MRVWKFVITGGPCAGKTTALDILKNELTKKGYKIIIVPETATELISSGFYPNELGNKKFHALLLERSIKKYEASIKEAEKSECDTIIFYDRGLLDFKAYISNKIFCEIMKEYNLNENNIIEIYDAIFHLVTAADGAEEFYTNANNKARSEGLEKAKELDKKTLDVWIKHPNLKIIDNSTDFNKKIDRLLKEIYLILNIE